MVVRRVELADEDADVGLEQTRADDDQDEPDIEHRHHGDRHAEVPARDQDPAPQHRAPLADEAVGDPSARQARQVHHRGVEAVHRAGRRGVEAETTGGGRRHHEEDQQRAHAVVAEALPHLGEEERGQAARVSEESAILRARQMGGGVGGGGHGRESSM